eukprot:1878472-Pleurochrysis_carterae.AAC.3
MSQMLTARFVRKYVLGRTVLGTMLVHAYSDACDSSYGWCLVRALRGVGVKLCAVLYLAMRAVERRFLLGVHRMQSFVCRTCLGDDDEARGEMPVASEREFRDRSLRSPPLASSFKCELTLVTSIYHHHQQDTHAV